MPRAIFSVESSLEKRAASCRRMFFYLNLAHAPVSQTSTSAPRPLGFEGAPITTDRCLLAFNLTNTPSAPSNTAQFQKVVCILFSVAVSISQIDSTDIRGFTISVIFLFGFFYKTQQSMCSLSTISLCVLQ